MSNKKLRQPMKQTGIHGSQYDIIFGKEAGVGGRGWGGGCLLEQGHLLGLIW